MYLISQLVDVSESSKKLTPIQATASVSHAPSLIDDGSSNVSVSVVEPDVDVDIENQTNSNDHKLTRRYAANKDSVIDTAANDTQKSKTTTSYQLDDYEFDDTPLQTPNLHLLSCAPYNPLLQFNFLNFFHTCASILFTITCLALCVSTVTVGIYDAYIHPLLEESGQLLGMASERNANSAYAYNHRNDFTYYKRTCGEEDSTADRQESLYWDANSTTHSSGGSADFADAMMRHGAGILPNLISPTLTVDLRNAILRMNAAEPIEKQFDLKESTNRWSLRLNPADTTHDPQLTVKRAMKEMAAHPVLRNTLEELLGDDPALVELAAITSDPGAPGQGWHSDTWNDASALISGRRYSSLYSLFVYLQDTHADMGPTGFCPGTHMCTSVDATALCFYATPSAGGGVLLNSQTLHQGSGNTAHEREDGTRVMLILTFASRPMRGEGRQLPLGSVYGIPWYMWGHTLHDLDTILTHPWNALQSLGLQKSGEHYGISYLMGSVAAHSENKNNELDPLPEWFLERDVWVGWRETCLEWFVWSCAVWAVLVGGYYGLLLYVSFSTKNVWENMAGLSSKLTCGVDVASIVQERRDANLRKPPTTTSKQAFGAYKNTPTDNRQSILSKIKTTFALNFTLLFLLATLLHYWATHNLWAIGVANGTRFTSVDFPPLRDLRYVQSDYREVIVHEPDRNDVLFTDRLDAYYTFRQGYLYDYHPGNTWFRNMLRTHVAPYKSSLVAPETYIQNTILPRLDVNNRRFLRMDRHGHWIPIEYFVPMATLVQRELVGMTFPVLRILGKELDFMLQQCDYGNGGRQYGVTPGSHTAMTSVHIPEWVGVWKEILFKERWRVKHDKPDSKPSTKRINGIQKSSMIANVDTLTGIMVTPKVRFDVKQMSTKPTKFESSAATITNTHSSAILNTRQLYPTRFLHTPRETLSFWF